jgi:hypothetical protein
MSPEPIGVKVPRYHKLLRQQTVPETWLLSLHPEQAPRIPPQILVTTMLP